MLRYAALFILFIPVICLAEGETQILDDMKKEIIDMQIEKFDKLLPKVKDHSEKSVESDKKDENIFSFGISYRNCIAQGLSQDECLSLNKNTSKLENYDIKNPKLPSLDETKDDLFFRFQIRN